MNRWIMWIIILFIISALVFLLYNAPSSSGHTEIRAAMDIGSGATNLKVAKVDTTTDKIISKIYEQSIPVSYQSHLEKSSNNTFDNEVMAQGTNAIKTLKDVADSYHVKKVVAVATAAFRQATNAPQFVQQIEQQTGVKVHIINQDEEGILAFRGALAITPAQPQQTVVWDIGGGSMQLTTLTKEGTYLVEKGKTASTPFRNFIIQQIEGKDIQSVSTPNPIGENELQGALQYARSVAQEINPMLKERLHDPQIQVLAVGNLFNYSISPLVSNKKVERYKLQQAITPLLNKTDKELPGGAFADVTVSNPILVLGYMQALDIPFVTVVSVNNADGALTYPPYWEENQQQLSNNNHNNQMNRHHNMDKCNHNPKRKMCLFNRI